MKPARFGAHNPHCANNRETVQNTPDFICVPFGINYGSVQELSRIMLTLIDFRAGVEFMMTYAKRTRGARVVRSGAAAVELAVLLPFLMFLCVIAADWARLMHYSIEVNDCARSGALYAADTTYASQSQYANVTDAALAETPELASTATVTSTTSANNQYVTVTVAVPFKTITNFPGVPSSQTVSRSVQMRVAPQSAR